MVHLVVGPFREGSFQQTGTKVVREWMTYTGVIQTKEREVGKEAKGQRY